MKRLTTFIFSAIFLFSASSVSAQQFNTQSIRSGNNVVINREETFDRDLFVTGKTVTVSGTINGDLYAAGGTVIIDGTVNGDVLAAGGFVSISGEVAEDVRVAGGQLTISGQIDGNTTLAGGNLDITESASLGESLVAAGGNLFVASPVEGNVNAGLGNLTILNSIGGDIEAFVGSMNLTQTASVSGNIDYWSEDQITMAQGASVSGNITRNEPRAMAGTEFAEGASEAAEEAFVTTGRIVLFLSLLIIGLMLVKFAPNYTKSTSQIMAEKPLNTAFVGLLGLIVTPVAAVLLMITIIGIPLGLIVLATYAIFLYVSRVFIIYWIGDYVLNRVNRKNTDLWTFVVGILIYGLLAIIPVIGGIFKFIALLLGLGAMLVSYKSTYKKMHKNKIV